MSIKSIHTEAVLVVATPVLKVAKASVVVAKYWLLLVIASWPSPEL